MHFIAKTHQNRDKITQNRTIGGVFAKCFEKMWKCLKIWPHFCKMFADFGHFWSILAIFGHFLHVFWPFLGHFCIYGGEWGAFRGFSVKFGTNFTNMGIYGSFWTEIVQKWYKNGDKLQIWGKCGQIGRKFTKNVTKCVFFIDFYLFLPIFHQIIPIFTSNSTNLPH